MIVNKALAEDFATKWQEFGAWFNDMTALSLQIENHDEAKKLRRTLIDMLNMLDDAVRAKLLAQYPELFPWNDDEDKTF
jgi:hypothetical protein